MADQVVVNTLSEWNLQVLIPIFEDEGVDEEAFNCLDEECIKSLIPKVGLRAKFKKRYLQRNSTYKDPILVASRRDPVLVVESVPIAASSVAVLEDVPVVPVATRGEPDVFIVSQKDPLSDETPNGRESVFLSKEPVSVESSSSKALEHNTEFAQVDVMDNPLGLLNENSSEFIDFSYRKQFEKWRHTHFNATFNVVGLLENSVDGLTVLKGYREEGSLNSTTRQMLVHIIVDEMLRKSCRFRWEEFDYVAESIVKTFPTENKEVYFIAPCDKVISRGKLIDRYRNKRRRLSNYGLIPNQRRRRTKPLYIDRPEIPDDADSVDIKFDVSQFESNTSSGAQSWVSILK